MKGVSGWVGGARPQFERVFNLAQLRLLQNNYQRLMELLDEANETHDPINRPEWLDLEVALRGMYISPGLSFSRINHRVGISSRALRDAVTSDTIYPPYARREKFLEDATSDSGFTTVVENEYFEKVIRGETSMYAATHATLDGRNSAFHTLGDVAAHGPRTEGQRVFQRRQTRQLAWMRQGIMESIKRLEMPQ